MARPIGVRAAFITILCVNVVMSDNCGVIYKDGSKPLLYGGVYGRCEKGCQRRDDIWGQLCSFNKRIDPKLVCSPEATNSTYEMFKSISNGTAVQLSPCDLMKYLRGRTLWILGDSHARSFYRAMQCFLIDFWNHQECKASLDDTTNAQLYNLPVAPGGSNCFHLLGAAGGRVCVLHVVKGTSLVNNTKVAEGGVLPLLHKELAQPQDVFYINFGIWHKTMSEWQSSYIPALDALGQYYNSTKSRFPHVVFRETPAQHKQEPNATRCLPAAGFLYNSTTGELLVDSSAREQAQNYAQSWLLGLPLNRVALQILPKYSIPVLSTFNMTVAMHDTHAIAPGTIGQTDCKHYCQPGVPQMWIWHLYEYLSSPNGVMPIPNKEMLGYKFPCKAMKSAISLELN